MEVSNQESSQVGCLEQEHMMQLCDLGCTKPWRALHAMHAPFFVTATGQAASWWLAVGRHLCQFCPEEGGGQCSIAYHGTMP